MRAAFAPAILHNPYLSMLQDVAVLQQSAYKFPGCSKSGLLENVWCERAVSERLMCLVCTTTASEAHRICSQKGRSQDYQKVFLLRKQKATLLETWPSSQGCWAVCTATMNITKSCRLGCSVRECCAEQCTMCENRSVCNLLSLF